MVLKRSPRAIALTLAVIMALGLALHTSPVSAATYSITIHARLCPAGQPTTDIFKDCHGHKADADTHFQIDYNGNPHAINTHGNLTFSRLSAGSHVVRRTEGQGPNEFLRERVFCLWKDGTSKEIIPSRNGNFVVTLTSGSVTCDVYLVPIAAT